MILTSTTETISFTPPWHADAVDAPTYFLRACSVIERGQMEAELAGPHRAGQVYGYELRAAVRGGVQALLADDPELDRVLGLIDAEAQGEAHTLSEDDNRLLAETRSVLAEHWAEYRDLNAQLERRRAIAPIVALSRFCTGWERVRDDSGSEVPFARGRDGFVAEAALRQLPQLDLMSAGSRAYALQYGGGHERPLPPPSTSDAGPASSTRGRSKGAGSSAGRSGRRIHA